MKEMKQTFLVIGLSDVQLIFCDFDNNDKKENKRKRPKNNVKDKTVQFCLDFKDYTNPKRKFDETITNKYFINDKDVIGYETPFCKHCHSRKVIKWDYTTRKWINTDYEKTVKIQRYKCNNCGKLSQTEFKNQYEPYCNISEELKEKSTLVKELNWSSLRDISKYYEIFNDVSISHETVRQSLITIKSNYINYNILKLSGYYGYDAQWIKINKIWKYRHVLLDLYYNVPIAELFTDKDTYKIVYDFINENTKQYERIAIVTDLKPGYRKIMKDLNFQKHQLCIFHLKLNIIKAIREYYNKKRRYCAKELKKTYKMYSLSFIEQEVEKLIKAEKKEIKYSLQLLYYLFEERTYFKALRYMDLLRDNLNQLHPFLIKYLEKNFFPFYKNFLCYLEKPFNRKLNRTNNLTENYFRNTLPKGQKRKYRTFEGVINQIYHKGNDWIKNQKNQHTK